MVKFARDRRGYSLPELMMVVAITGILAMTGPRLMIQLNRFILGSKANLALQRDARAAISILTRNVRQAQSNTLVIDRAAGQPYYSRITFTKIGGTPMVFEQSGRSLIMTAGTTTSTLTRNLRYLSFALPRSDDLSILSVSMTLEKSTYEGRLKSLHMASERVRVMN